jgi:tetratricopeptide (TPR) repeat protein
VTAPSEPGIESLEQEREFLLRSITDLDDELSAGDISVDDHASLKDGYTARAAQVLRALDASRSGAAASAAPRATPAPAAPRATPARRSSPRPAAPRPRSVSRSSATRRTGGRRGVKVVAVGVVAVMAGLLVASFAGQRSPGQTITGTIPTLGPSVGAQLNEAQADLTAGKYLEAVKLFDAVIRQDPKNAEALAYRGWLLRLTGVAAKDASLVDRGLASVRAAEAADVNYPDAHFFAGEILLRDKNDPAGAVTEFRAFLGHNPPSAMVPQVQGELDAAVAQSGTPGSAPPTTG